MNPLPLLRSRDPLAALAALLVLAMIVAGPPRSVIRMKDESHAITISLATPPAEPQPPAPASPPPPRAAMPLARVVKPHPVPAKAEPRAQVTERAAEAPQAAPLPDPVAISTVAAPHTPVAPPRPPAPAQPAAIAPATIEASYVAKLRAYLESIRRYPTTREARSMRPQGRVRVWLQIDRAGALRDSGIEESSGSMILDSAALATVRQGAYPRFPEEMWSGQPTHRFEVTLEYTLQG